MAHAAGWCGAHGFKNIEIVLQAGEEACLEFAFGVFVVGVAVEDDAGADAHFAVAHAVRALWLQGQRADRHRHAEVADLAVITRIEPADGAGVDAARVRLQFADDFHGAALGRAGDRAAGIQRIKNFGQRGVVAQLRGDGGGHLQHAGVALHVEQRRHFHAAGDGHARDVVAQQVDDHQVLGAVLGIGGEVGGAQDVFRLLRRWRGRRRAFHRPRGQHAAAVAHEQFGRQRQHGAAVVQRDQCAVRDGLAAAQARVQRVDAAKRVKTQPVRVIDLVGVAGRNVVVNARQRRAKRLPDRCSAGCWRCRPAVRSETSAPPASRPPARPTAARSR